MAERRKPTHQKKEAKSETEGEFFSPHGPHTLFLCACICFFGVSLARSIAGFFTRAGKCLCIRRGVFGRRWATRRIV